MKKTNGLKLGLAVLTLSSALFIFTGCKKKTTKPTEKPADEDVKYDATLKMRYKVFNGEAEIVEIEKQGTKISIPETIGGSTVTRMSCTYTDSELEEVEFPASLKYFTGNGFMDCENLRTVTFAANSSIANIPSMAFRGTKLSSITIPASVRTISYESFRGIETLSTVTFESGSQLEQIGPYAFFECKSIGSIILPDKLESIGESAFEKCSTLTTLNTTSASSLSVIENYAFSDCEKLETIDLSSNHSLNRIGDNAFRGCIKLSTLSLNNELREIGKKAFYDTRELKKVVLPENITFVGDEAFVNAGIEELELNSGSDTTFGTNSFSQYEYDPIRKELVPIDDQITKLTLNGSLTIDKVFTEYAPQVRLSLHELNVKGERIAPSAFKNCTFLSTITIADGVKVIGESAFEGCDKIVALTLSNDIKEIAENTFKGCTSLKTINMPSSVTAVRSGAFDGCVEIANLDLSNLIEIGSFAFRNTAITDPVFSENIVSIGESAFENCSNINEVVINSTASSTTIKKFAFANCTNITRIVLSKNVIALNNAFASDTKVTEISVRGEFGLATLFGESKEEVSKKITSITIQDDTEVIEAGAFTGCLLVDNITIPSTVKVIGDEAFKGCRGITTIDLPTGLTKLGKYAFADCDKLKISALPNGVVDLSEGVFKNDSSIEEFTLNSSTQTIGAHAFSGCSNLTIAAFKSVDTPNTTITSIGDYAFNGCTNLELVVLPTNLTSIGAYAFNGCLSISVSKTNEALTSIGAYAFKGCKGITSFEFANDLSEDNMLGNAILEGCTKVSELKIFGTTSLEFLFGESVYELKPVLSEVVIKGDNISLANNMFKGFTAIREAKRENPDAIIVKIGESAFEECISLTEFNLDGVEEVGKNAFAGSGLLSIEIPSNGIKLGKYVFANCSSLAELTFASPDPEDENFEKCIKIIPEGSFQNTILVDVVLPDTVEGIDEAAFANIITLSSFTISNDSHLVEIDDSSFAGCSNILEFVIPASMEVLGKAAFSGCSALRDVTFMANDIIDTICPETFKNCLALTNINLPDTITVIGANAFENCTCLARLDLPDSLEEIGTSVFTNCQSLNELTIPEKIEVIPNATFKGCYMLEVVTWNSNIKEIGAEAFFNTPYSSPIPNTITTIGNKAFSTDGADGKPIPFTNAALVLGVPEQGENSVNLVIGDEAFRKSGITSLTLGSKVIEIGSNVFAQALELTSVDISGLKITAISEFMFDGCESLANVIMGSNNSINTIGEAAFRKTAVAEFNFANILAIGDSAFEEDTALIMSINLGASLNVTIGNKAFYKSGITGLVLGKMVIYVGSEAFAETSITSADLSKLNITEISASFFANCTALATVSVNSNIRTICANAFTGTAITSLAFLNDTPIERIMESAFSGCEEMTEVSIPDTVSYVGASAFSGCSKLASMSWSTSANVINDETFNGCNKLVDIDIPENVSRIGKLAFNPVALGSDHAKINFYSVTPPSVDEAFISNFLTVDVTVPAGTIDAYEMNYVFNKVVKNLSERA